MDGRVDAWTVGQQDIRPAGGLGMITQTHRLLICEWGGGGGGLNSSNE